MWNEIDDGKVRATNEWWDKSSYHSSPAVEVQEERTLPCKVGAELLHFQNEQY